ncbi:MAG: cysteine desulfurase [Bacteroidales bacterium]|jgi:cysteine desulfurase/selenocysteine lyase|nr:cysteine desulfurase [Bacteroidales bacterium]
MNRQDFEILNQQVYNQPLIYFDNAATTQKPKAVIESLTNYYKTINSNIHRGVHYLSQQATEQFELARQRVAHFINAEKTHEIIFTHGATESINLIAASFGKTFLKAGDEILISEMEHHANIVPWQLACEMYGARLKVLPFNETGVLEIEKIESLLSEKTKIITINHVSNTLGTINPIRTVIETAHRHHIPVMIDGAQAVSHLKIDVQDLDCDFYCFSGHKMYAPMGVGVLYGKEKWLDQMQPYQGGGEMIEQVTFDKTTYNQLPYKFEAGTPSVGDVIGLKTAIDYIETVGVDTIGRHEEQLCQYAHQQLAEVEGIKFFGTAPHKAAIISFLVGAIHPYDMGTIIDRLGIAVRTGHHCTQPIMQHYAIPGTIRASFALYNEKEEIDRFVSAVKRAAWMLRQ